MPDLSGDLSAFGVRRVLELLRDVGSSGEMLVKGDHAQGRILVREGRIAYATTASGSDTVAELDSLLRTYESDGDGLPSLEEVLAEQLTDVIHDLTALETGTFEVAGSAALQDEDVYSFPVDDVFGRVDTRIEEWRTIRELIPSDGAVFRLASRLPGESGAVTFDSSTWSLLAAVAGGASMAEAAASLSMKPLPAARAFADLIGRGLIEIGSPLESGPIAAIKREDEPEALELQPEMPQLEPAEEAVTFSARDLSRNEIDDVIRNIGRGIFPG